MKKRRQPQQGRRGSATYGRWTYHYRIIREERGWLIDFEGKNTCHVRVRNESDIPKVAQRTLTEYIDGKRREWGTL